MTHRDHIPGWAGCAASGPTPLGAAMREKDQTMMEPLAREDYDTLLEALEAWEEKDAAADIMGVILTSAFSRDLPREAANNLQLEAEGRARKRKLEHAARKERSVLLRAKLIQLRAALDAAEATTSARGKG